MAHKYPKIFQMQFLLFVLRKWIASLWLSVVASFYRYEIRREEESSGKQVLCRVKKDGYDKHRLTVPHLWDILC